MGRYVLKGTKVKGKRISKIRLDDDRTLILNGEAVEMSDEEHDSLVDQGFTLHKRPDRASDKQDEQDDKENTDPPEKGGDK